MPDEFHQTIAALSTPPGESGIAVIRMSGEDSLPVLGRIFSSNGDNVRPTFKHRRVYHGFVTDGDETLDEVMCSVMHGPESYTGEDTVEISCHGNTLVVDRILNAIFQEGVRAAAPGEFTKRAFLNGKMDLIQAEAVADLIHARSDLQRRVAQRQLAGGLSERINGLAKEMLELLGFVEANIDFIEDDIDTLDTPSWLRVLDTHDGALGDLLQHSAFSKPFRHGYQVVIAGPVNAGKSSLFNRLVGENRAIVTEVPGTTRDVLREPIALEGLLFLVQDTAGLRGTTDQVEQIGVGRAEDAVGDADIVVFVVDGTEPLSEDTAARLSAMNGTRPIVVLNKSDLETRLPPEALGKRFPQIDVIESSAKTGDGLAEIKKTLIERVGEEHLNWIARERVVLNSRLISILRNAKERAAVLRTNLEQHAPLEILALDAREVLQLYESATGKRYTDDLLDTIFSRFCIGK